MTGADLSPGLLVEAPAAPEWGRGQVQSVVGSRVTVNFEHRGKVVLDLRAARLTAVDPAAPDRKKM
ncbi:MAG TPA: DUF3553 domain-containing protein [Geminicoccaceae bacterium]|nr:DUF3553 domain-containing protein [Geminicoccus sp.]HMU51888.1 DUF3553 domain-containing protein [Geminicoccaceae bacterium]